MSRPDVLVIKDGWGWTPPPVQLTQDSLKLCPQCKRQLGASVLAHNCPKD